MVEPSTTIKRSPTAVWREIDGQVAVVSIDVNRVRLLNAVGSFVWARCDAATAEQLARQVADHFKISMERATADVSAFLEDLRTRGMVSFEGGS